jgi:MoxR-like ATPase
MVVATQNPIEMEGVFELPEAQRDRFQFKLTVDLPDREEEAELLSRFDQDPTLDATTLPQVVSIDGLLSAREYVRDVYVDDRVKEYVLDLVRATRENPDVEYGASPRATLAFLDAGKARAAIRGREYVIPDDVKALAPPILVHRLVLSTDAELSDVSHDDVIEDVLASVEPPGSEGVRDARDEGASAAVSDGGPAGSDE